MVPASRRKRYMASFIDGLISTGLGFIPVVGIVLGIAYALLKDGLHIQGLHYCSIGKNVMGLRIVSAENGTPRYGWLDSLKRNITLLIPVVGIIEALFVLFAKDRRRIGDKIAGTMVIGE